MLETNERSNKKQVGNIILSCMDSDYRELLDEVVIEYEKTYDKSLHDISGYSALYWFLRYSKSLGDFISKIKSNDQVTFK